MNETRYTIRNDFWLHSARREHTLNVSIKKSYLFCTAFWFSQRQAFKRVDLKINFSFLSFNEYRRRYTRSIPISEFVAESFKNISKILRIYNKRCLSQCIHYNDIVVWVGAKDIKGLDRNIGKREELFATKHECERPLRKEIGERPARSSSVGTAGHPITIFVDVVVALAADVCKWRWRRKCRRTMYGNNDEWRHDAATSKKSSSPIGRVSRTSHFR